MSTNKKYLVTGGAGFLGSHLCKKLLDLGNKVICVDNYYTSTDKNIDQLIRNPNFEFKYHDIINPLYVDVEGIFNLACPASPPQYQLDPIYTTKTNVMGSLNMLGLAKSLKVKIFQASTSEVYGDPEVHPQIETYNGSVNPIGIRACYDEGKRCAESLFFDYQRQHGIDIRVARIFNTYGPNMQVHDGRLVSNFITQALAGIPLTIYGDGTQTRSLCYVDDLIDGIIAMMNINGPLLTPVNLGNPNEISVISLAKRIISLTNSTSVLEFKSLPSDDPSKRKPNISIAKDLLDWEPRVSLDDGLNLTINYFTSKYYTSVHNTAI